MKVRIRFDRYPDGKNKALTMSYDDGQIHDRKLVEIFNRFGIRGTFNLNSGLFGKANRINADEVAELYAGHEVAVHTVTHPSLSYVPNEVIAAEILADRQNLEDLVGYPVRGMAYPNGVYDENVLSLLPAYGIEYARTVRSHRNFMLPMHFLEWHPTCHHRHDVLQLGKQFLELNKKGTPFLMYVWGHSYEFPNDQNWPLIEEFCEMVSNQQSIWYATNQEIVTYWKAVKSLVFSADASMIYNPSAISVWLSVDDQIVEIHPGETKRFNELTMDQPNL
ncbi:MAG: polysaccharide deacetylase [Bacilli bacterium]|nr:polysaccharide deacetylase [Bacilli bacterium]